MPVANANTLPTTDATPTVDTSTPSAALLKVQYAIKTSLSLTLAYLIPMALGWPQPQTAAITVMLIAATGLTSESLQKGVSRIIGTVAGAVIGLCLIALFPQDRLTYLLVASITVSLIIYLYNAYQNDGTVFMLTAVVTLMVFNGGDADGAFIYGAERAFVTAFGVVVYSVVASCLWPVKAANNTRTLATGLARQYAAAFERLIRPQADPEHALDEQLSELLTQATAFQEQFASVKNSADGIADYQQEWNVIVSCYEEMQTTLLPALHQALPAQLEFEKYLTNYPELLDHVSGLFNGIHNSWQGREPSAATAAMALVFNAEKMALGNHLAIASVVSRAETLSKIQYALIDLQLALKSLLFDRNATLPDRHPKGKPAFVWLDLENAKTAVRAFTAFWISTALWLQFNPPGGFMFVTMCTVLIPLSSYTPATPKTLIALFTLSFLFAVPAYVFLLPQLTHWLELGLFLFVYGFIGLFIFPGPVALFFLLGLFTLGIQNTMNYHFDALGLIMLMFYMICAIHVVVLNFPFSSRPEKIYASLQRRFFKHCARRITLCENPKRSKLSLWLSRGMGNTLLAKMVFWGSKIDSGYFSAVEPSQIVSLNRACELLWGELQVLELRRNVFAENLLVSEGRKQMNNNPLAQLCATLAEGNPASAFDLTREKLTGIQERLDQLLGEDYLQRYDRPQLAQFYLYLNLQSSLLDCIETCRMSQQALDWQQLAETRF
ncbi:MAG: hypothetical protein ACI9JM_003178 [Halioglobus sp.]|jgi:hypothetical protein